MNTSSPERLFEKPISAASRRLWQGVGCLGAGLVFWAACTTLPTPKFTKYSFPKDAHLGEVKRPHVVMGLVRTKVNFTTLDPNHEEKELCQNYYNKAVRDLVKRAKESGADAVVDVKSVVFFESGKSETFSTPECSDDGEEGQILTQGIAVKWKPEGEGDAPVSEENTGKQRK